MDKSDLLELENPDVNENDEWKVRYWTIFIGQSLSLLGSSLTQFVLMWWITDTTGSISYLAIAGMAALLPQALLSPLGGVLADRYNRRLIMIVSDAISALCMAVLIFLFLNNSIELWHTFVMMAIRGAMQAFQSPASAASTAMLVPKSFIIKAAGLNQMMQGVTMVGSAPLGAFAISFMPLGWALSIDVITAILAITPLFVFTIPQIRQMKASNLMGTIKTEFLEGLSLVWQNQGLKRLYGLLGCVVLIVMPSYTFVPLLVKEYFNGGAREVGIMEGLAGVGMLLGGAIVTAMAPKRKIVWILIGSTITCLSLSFVAFTPSTLFWVAAMWWLINGIAFIFLNAPLTALLQTTIPNQLQGRVLSLLNTIMALAAPIGLVLATPLGELIGIRWLFAVVGIAGGMVSLFGFLSPSLRNLDRK
ncbi:MFS transporter [Sphingobacterium corticibacterium]|uniref:MFS transporter n=1 Tax=Sphingobacterium corticibacterium TaxID=2484746 RepID=A0A4Q6XNC2_9SPHI|nr:MFS transporter [Sphingobacterium corticibacterium]RZF57977.1 MFS transporter [Sphingobacterium corticibacterium]